MRRISTAGILLIYSVLFVAFTSCRKINERVDRLEYRLDNLENVTIASVDAQVTNISNTIPGIEQSITELEEYVSLLKKENVTEFSASVTNIEQYITNLNLQLTEIKNHTLNIVRQETVNNEVWIDVTLKTMNLYQSIQSQMSLVKVEINNVQQTITDLRIDVDQKLINYNTTFLTLINQTETSMMSWVNERFTAYYTIAEVNAQIHNLIVENNVEINTSINDLTVMMNEMSLNITNIYSKVIQETINYCDGAITQTLIQKIDEASINLNVTVENINTRITDIENRIFIIDNSINTINQQITAINVSIVQMTTLNEQITQYITILKEEGEAYENPVGVLMQIQDNLMLKIQELNVYVDNIVNNFNTTVIDVKNWVNVTFATIEQYNIINTTITEIQAFVNIVQTNILEINQNIVNISSNITNVQNNINVTVTDLDKSTREWVNKRLTEYMTVQKAEEQYALLAAQIKNMYEYIEDNDEESLILRMESLEKQIKSINLDITVVVKEAVEDAIVNHDGNVRAAIEKMEGDIVRIKSQIDAVNTLLADLKETVMFIKSEMTAIQHNLYRNIQSITPIPTYSDGSVAVKTGVSAIEFEIYPILSQENLNKSALLKCLSFDVLKVQTRAGSSENPLTNLPITDVEMSGDFLKVYIDCTSLYTDFLSDNQSAMGRLRFNDGELFKTSGYFMLDMKGSTSSYAELSANFMSIIDKQSGGKVPYHIVFKYNDNAVTDGIEVQSSGSSEKIYANIVDFTLTISTSANQIYAPESCADMFVKRSKLSSIDFGTGFNTSHVKTMSYMFYGTSIDKLDLSGFDFSNVNDMHWAFADIHTLAYLDFGNQNLNLNMNVDNMCGNMASASKSCIIRCNSLVQKILLEEKVQLNTSYIKWNLTDAESTYFEAVDLGLSVKWASWNVGATKPEEYGDYYAWGETETHYEQGDAQSGSPKWKTGYSAGYTWTTYKWCNGSSSSMTKYCTQSSYGVVDNKTILEQSDDVAHVKWGGSWRMPTRVEFDELINNCTWTWTTLAGVSGYRVTSNKTGYTNKSIFLPAAGGRYGTNLLSVGSGGCYWSSSLDSDDPNDAYSLYFSSGYVGTDDYGRYYGPSVRPVSE